MKMFLEKARKIRDGVIMIICFVLIMGFAAYGFIKFAFG